MLIVICLAMVEQLHQSVWCEREHSPARFPKSDGISGEIGPHEDLHNHPSLFMGAIGEFGDDTKVRTTTTNSPEKIRILFLGGTDYPAVCDSNAGGNKVIEGESVF